MFSKKHLRLILFTFAFIGFKVIIGFPLDTSFLVYTNEQFEVKNETQYPNGTVVGEFSYSDNEGNPINVTYYADKTGYGVELKAAKIVNPDKATYWKTSGSDAVKTAQQFKQTTDKIYRTQYNKNKKMDFRNEQKSADYETFYRNDVRDLKQCNKDKVRVYWDREKKIIKRALDNYQAPKTCGRY